MSHKLKDTYQSVTDTIVAALEKGSVPWVQPWNGAVFGVPRNFASKRAYRGINVLLLNFKALECGYATNRWLTYQQARSLGANVRKGESGTEVVLFKMLDVEDTAEPSQSKVIPLIRSFTVFNADQIDGLPAGLVVIPSPTEPWQACEAADVVLAHSGAHIVHGGGRAFYSPSLDMIQLPERRAFVSPTAYYQVALHELTHWSGAPLRCNRPLLGRQHIESYAFEELVAELGSAFLCNHCGLPGVLQHAGYIEHWLQALKNDKRLIFTAAAQAQKAADYLLPQVEVELQEQPLPQALA